MSEVSLYVPYSLDSGIMRNRSPSTTRWTTTLLSKVNLPHTINLRVLHGANVVTKLSKLGGNGTLVQGYLAYKKQPFPGTPQ